MRRQSWQWAIFLLFSISSCFVLLQYYKLSAHLPSNYDSVLPGQYARSLQGPPKLQLQDSENEITHELYLQIAQLKQEIEFLRSTIKSKELNDPLLSTNSKSHGNPYQDSGSYPVGRDSLANDDIETKIETQPSATDILNSCSAYVQRKIEESEISRGFSLNNEYEIIPFSHFTWSRIYPAELGLGKRVVEKPIGFKRKDLMASITTALEHLNVQEANRFSVDDFVEGEYRTVPTSGTQIDLVFRERQKNNSIYAQYRRLRLIRPFAPLRVVNTQYKGSRQLVNIVLPLAGRIDTFKGFMEKLVKLILRHDRRIFLTVVYFGNDGLHDVRNVITVASKKANFRHVKLLTLNETFSRGKALQVGAAHWSKGDVLLFMCDVDVVFSTRFLERCRMNAVVGQSVYYPIVFSLYNPQLIYPLQGKVIPPELDQLVISRDTGFWRDFGYGMTCQYRSDFFNVQGFDENIVGWGGEDVLLYRKYVKSNLAVVRSTDPGIFHLWHSKFCSTSFTSDQYRACITSRALNEASHAQLGLVAFKEDLDKHPSGNKPFKAKLQNSEPIQSKKEMR